MSEIKHKSQILATIDHLRARKSRPDINRICKLMQKCYKVSPKDTEADLKRCLNERSIFKVEYKDNVSYRNAAKWRKRAVIDMAVSNTERRVITSAIATLIYKDKHFLEQGIAFDDLVKVAAAQGYNFSKKELETIVNKELTFGSLMTLANGKLALGLLDTDPVIQDSPDNPIKLENNGDSNNTKVTSSANSSCRSSPQRTRGRPKKGTVVHNPVVRHAGVRVGERRKMAKKVFDPSDNNLPSKRKRGRPVGSINKSALKKRYIGTSSKNDKDGSASDGLSDPSGDEVDQEERPISQEAGTGGVCSVCHIQKPRGSNDTLVLCVDCDCKAHLKCIQSGSGIWKTRPDNTWLCPSCKTCVVCCETNDTGILTVCRLCSDEYHALCHEPRIPEHLKACDEWECNNCVTSKTKEVNSRAIILNSIEYNSQNSPVSPVEDPFLKPHELDRAPSKLGVDVPVDINIPDITNWSTEDVFEYFKEHHPEAAPILKEQEFDGQALSMARREDIVRGTGLALGPALTLYRIVVKLQTRKDDWTMCWG